ncbi:MAG: transporter [Chitinophagia bacterium]|nr:transporter [Chitinophagia bacterium]
MKKYFFLLILPFTALAQESGKIYSLIHTIDIRSKKMDTLWQGQAHYEAPNWSKDGSHLLLNRDGKIYAKSLQQKEDFKELNTGFADRCNNDHGISPDGKWLAISHSPVVDSANGKPVRKSVVYVVPIGGGTPRRITAISIEGGAEKRLTAEKGLDDGPEYSPDGKTIYYNSYADGSMEIWRMDAEGQNKKQLTNDAYSNWFAHPSPDGKWIVMISYLQDQQQQHPFGKDVKLRLMELKTGKISDLTPVFYGGQGTINVPSWSPDSKRLAFVSYKRNEEK